MRSQIGLLWAFTKLKIDARQDELLQLLDPFDQAINREEIRIEEASADLRTSLESQEYFDFIVDDASAIVEELVGISFVVCQTFITLVFQKLRTYMRLHQRKVVSLG